MFRRMVNVFLWVLCVCVSLFVVLSGLLVWRLSVSPISLDFLTPYLEEALTDSLSGHHVEVQETLLAWNPRRHNLDLRARAVTIRDDRGAVLAILPVVEVTLSRRALWRGTVALTAINLEGAQTILRRGTDGTIRFDAVDVMGVFMSEANSSPLLASLKEVRVSNGSLTVQDAQMGITWKAPQADLTLRRDWEGLTARLQVTTVVQGMDTTIDATLTFTKADERLRLDASFAQLRPSILAALMPRLDGLAGLDVPLDGRINVALDRRGTVHELHFEIRGGPGLWSLADVVPQPQPVAGVTARGRLDGASGTLQLDDATVALGTGATADVTLYGHGTVMGFKADDMADELTAQLKITLASHHIRTIFDTKLSYARASKQLEMSTTFANVRSTLLATLIPALDPLVGLDVPFDGTLAATMDAQGRLAAMQFALSGGPGHLSYPGVLPEPRPISRVIASGRLDRPNGTFRLDNAAITLGQGKASGPILHVSGKATGLGGDITAQGRVTLKTLPIADLGRYWPTAASPKARAWIVENIVAGTVEQAQADVALTIPGGELDAIKVQRLNGTLRYNECQVHYLRPLPPVTGVSGRGGFNLQGFQLRIEHGTTAGQTLSNGEVTISGLDRRRDAIAIQVDLAGPLREALRLLDHPRLNLLSHLNLQPEAISGQTAVQLGFAFSLIGKVQLKDVEIKAQGKLENVSIQNVLHGQHVEHGHLSLTLEKRWMIFKGPINFASVPLMLDWKEALTKEVAWRHDVHVAVPRIGHVDLIRLGLDLTDYAEGAFAADIRAKIGWGGEGEVQAALNLHETRLTLPFLGWQKTLGESGIARGTLQLEDGRPATLQRFEITAGTLTARGTAWFNQTDMRTVSVEMRDLAFGQSALRNVSIQHRDGDIGVTIGAGVLDAQPLLQRQPATHDHVDPREQTATPRLHLHAPGLRQVFFGPDRYLQHVQVEIKRGKIGWELIDIAGQIPLALVRLTRTEQHAIQEGATPLPRAFSVRYQPSPQGHYALVAHANDFGALLRALNVSENVTSGYVMVEGHTASPEPNEPLQATIEVKQFEIKDAPIIAQILAAASLPGLLNLLQSDGLMFSRFTAEVTMANGTLAINELHGYGGALGLTAQGEVNTGTGSLNVKGTIIPAYEINSLLGQIPVLNLLVGGKHQGLFAVTYRLTGELSEPQVSINPATALTPGFLRHVFDILEENSSNATEEFPTDGPPETSGE